VPGRDDADRRRLRQHRADLHRARVRAQHDLVGHVERVLHVARRVILRDRERLERVPVGLDLRALRDDEAELGEDIDGLEPHLREQVEMATADRTCRQRDIDAPCEVLLLPRAREAQQAGLHDLLDLLLGLVGRGADLRTLARRQLAELLHHLGDLALLAEELRLRGADRLLVDERTVPARNSSPRPSSFAIRSGVVLIDVGKAKRRLFRSRRYSSEIDGSPLSVDDLLKRDRIADRDLGEHLAVERDARAIELADQLGVADAEVAGGRVDALDPQRTKVPLA
jgi:hypothetical protein